MYDETPKEAGARWWHTPVGCLLAIVIWVGARLLLRGFAEVFD